VSVLVPHRAQKVLAESHTGYTHGTPYTFFISTIIFIMPPKIQTPAASLVEGGSGAGALNYETRNLILDLDRIPDD
jgi:hypothetical protein